MLVWEAAGRAGEEEEEENVWCDAKVCDRPLPSKLSSPSGRPSHSRAARLVRGPDAALAGSLGAARGLRLPICWRLSATSSLAAL